MRFLPLLLLLGACEQVSPQDEMRRILSRTTSKTWKEDSRRLLAILDRIEGTTTVEPTATHR